MLRSANPEKNVQTCSAESLRKKIPVWVWVWDTKHLRMVTTTIIITPNKQAKNWASQETRENTTLQRAGKVCMLMCCCACMTRTPPNVRRRLTGGAQKGPGEGILRHTQGQNKTSCEKCFAEVSGLTAHQAQMPQHESCRHIHEDRQEFIFGSMHWVIHACAISNFKNYASTQETKMVQQPNASFQHVQWIAMNCLWAYEQAKSWGSQETRENTTLQRAGKVCMLLCCCACMTRTPPNVRRRLTGGAQKGPGEGILRHTQGQNKTSCEKCFAEVSGLTAHQAQMPQHESCRHIHEDRQEFIFGSMHWVIHACAISNFKNYASTQETKMVQQPNASFQHVQWIAYEHMSKQKAEEVRKHVKTQHFNEQEKSACCCAVARVWLELLPMSDGVWPAGPKRGLERGSYTRRGKTKRLAKSALPKCLAWRPIKRKCPSMSHADTSTRTVKNSSSDPCTESFMQMCNQQFQELCKHSRNKDGTFPTCTVNCLWAYAKAKSWGSQETRENTTLQGTLHVVVLLRVYDSNSSQCPTASDRRGPKGAWRGDLKAHAGAKQNVLRKVLCRSVWLDGPSSANAPAWVMPTHPRGPSRIHLRIHALSHSCTCNQQFQELCKHSRNKDGTTTQCLFPTCTVNCLWAYEQAKSWGSQETRENTTLQRAGKVCMLSCCCACMTRTPPDVRRRLTGGAQKGPGEGILRHTQGQNKTSCEKCFAEVSGLTAHQAQMPQHESCRHIHEDRQEFIFGSMHWVFHANVQSATSRAMQALKKQRWYNNPMPLSNMYSELPMSIWASKKLRKSGNTWKHNTSRSRKSLHAVVLLRVYDSNSSQCPTASDRRGPKGAWRGDLKAHAGAKQNVLRKVLCRSLWLDGPSSANAPAWVMPTHPRGPSRIHLRIHALSLSCKCAISNFKNYASTQETKMVQQPDASFQHVQWIAYEHMSKQKAEEVRKHVKTQHFKEQEKSACCCAVVLLRVYDSNSSQCPTASDRRGPKGAWRGDLKAHAGAKQNVLRKVLCRSVWLDGPSSANAPAWVMPTHPRGRSRIHLRIHALSLSCKCAISNFKSHASTQETKMVQQPHASFQHVQWIAYEHMSKQKAEEVRKHVKTQHFNEQEKSACCCAVARVWLELLPMSDGVWPAGPKRGLERGS